MNITETIDLNSVKSGEYVAISGSQAYSALLALEVLGSAKMDGAKYTPDARLVASFTVGRPRAANPKKVRRHAKEFFAQPLRDYEGWREKWWREAIQNAVDAGATTIDCWVKPIDGPEGQKGYEAGVADNGVGMHPETLEKKFLDWGGTGKTTSRDAGGFGEAKRLLLDPWMWWEVHTGAQYQVDSDGLPLRTSDGALVAGPQMAVLAHGMIGGEEYDADPAPWYQGTVLRVGMPEDAYTTAEHAVGYIKKCWLPGIRLTVNGEVVHAGMAVGEEVTAFTGASVHHLKKARLFSKGAPRVAFVRTGVPSRPNLRLLMFTLDIPSDVPGVVTVELNKPSVEVLTSNRDGFRDGNLRVLVSDFIDKLSKDASGALRTTKSVKVYGGLETFRAERQQAEATALASVPMRELTQEEFDALARELEEFMKKIREATKNDPTSVAPSATTKAASDLDLEGPEHARQVVKLMMWKPDIILINDQEDYRVPSKFKPENMPLGIRKLLRFWAECCRWIMMQLNICKEYGVGFIFDEDAGAAYKRHRDPATSTRDWLMLGPFKSWLSGETWSLSNKKDIHQLYAMACHEITHLQLGASDDYHGPAFAGALTHNMARIMPGIKRLKSILADSSKAEREIQKDVREKKSKGKKAVKRFDPDVREWFETAWAFADGARKIKLGLDTGNYDGTRDTAFSRFASGASAWLQIASPQEGVFVADILGWLRANPSDTVAPEVIADASVKAMNRNAVATYGVLTDWA